MLRGGCLGFLASVSVDSSSCRLHIDVVEVVKDFSDVFPEDIAGLPLDKEVEF